MMPRVLIAAGGTGGHVFPALAVAQALRGQGWHAEWVGTDRGLEARVIPDAGIGLHILRFTGLRGKGLSAWLGLPLRLVRALMDALVIVRHVRPSVVVAFGGYVTFPVGLAARLSRIPLCIHEQNAVMGTANRWLARIASRVMVSFPQTRFAPRPSILIGNPVRASILNLADLAERAANRTGALRVLVMGGSLGATALNQYLPGCFAEVARQGQRLTIRHQSGQKDLEMLRQRYRGLGLEADCTAFIRDMESAYAWADLVICRAGASTVTEVAAAGLPAIFIPLPSAIDDHQTANARYLSDSDAGWLIRQADLIANNADVSVNPLVILLLSLTRETCIGVGQRARSRAMHDAARHAAEQVAGLIGRHHQEQRR
jgi:UDP-N-acetylglucosamine--N-acetylmuramyl-(pentapeptide) pyrophosphoryl-undecaprenol N-acetylglucosamine transferase